VPPASWLSALSRTRQTAFARLATILGASEITDGYWEQLESAFLQADLGTGLTAEILSALREQTQREGLTHAAALAPLLRTQLLQRLPIQDAAPAGQPPAVLILVGVNGSGKTTCAAKLAAYHQSQGKSVLLAAADTFRAAAVDQLGLWASRLGIEMIRGESGSDPAAVVYSAAAAALARRIDILVVDTSGRMHTRHNLMAELEKVCRVAGKVIPGAPHEVYLVLDATTGQNGVLQAQGFASAVRLTGVILAKLDTSTRGGVGLAVAHQMGLPISFVGLGEGSDDLVPFDPGAYVDGLLYQGAGR